MSKFKELISWSFPKANKDIGEYNRKEKTYYLIGMFGQNIIYNIIGAALSLFYSDVVMIDIAVVGVIFTLARVWDAINDPIMGVVMERTNTRWGKCRPYLKYFPILIGIVTVLLFMPLSTTPMWFRIAYLSFMYFLWSPIYTLCDIPLWSLPSRMVPDEERRSKLIAAARIVGTIAGTLTAIYAPIKNFFGKIDLGWFPNVGLANYDGYFSQEQGYLLATSVLCLIGVICFKFIFPNVRERVKVADKEKLTLKGTFSLLKENKPFVRIVISGILGSTKVLILTAGMYFCKWVLGNGYEGIWVIVLGAPFLVGTLLAYVLTPKLGKRFTKKGLYLWSSYLGAIPMIILFFVAYKHLADLATPLYLSIALGLLIIYGFFSGFSAALQPMMIADSVDYVEWKCGKRADGVFFSGLTFISKLSSGIAILISNILLGIVSYTSIIEELTEKIAAATASGTIYEVNFATEYPKVSLMMFLLITLVPMLGCILQAIPMHRYEITDKFYAEISEEIHARRAKWEEVAASMENETEK